MSFSLPSASISSGTDKIRAGDLDCSNSIGGSTNFEMGFTGVINNAKSIEAKQNLITIESFQSTYRFMHNSYANDLDKLDFIAPKTSEEGGTAYYTYQILEASKTAFKARATAVEDWDGDGIKNEWEINQDKQLVETAKD